MNILYEKKQNPLSVCFFSHSAQLGGAERSLLELVTELIQDHEVMCSVILPKEGSLRGKLDEVGAETLITDYFWWCDSTLPPDEEISHRQRDSFKSAVEQMLCKLKKINPDVILTNTLVIPWGSVVASILNKPHVWFICEFGRLDHDLKFFLPFQRVLALVKESSNIIFTNSKAVQNELFGKNPKKNILAVKRYIDIPADALSEDNKDYFERKTATKLIIAGNICATKDQENAILAVNELIRQGKDVELIVVGYADQQYLKKLKILVENEKLNDHVKFFDYKENIYPMLNHADIALVCSRNEAFGRIILEAMLLRKPVIATNSGGTPELIKDGFNGLLYEVGDYHQLAEKIKYLIKHNHKIEELGEHGYEFAKKEFTKEKYGGKVYELLKSLKNTENPSSSDYSQFVINLMLDILSSSNLVLAKKDGVIVNLNEVVQTLTEQLAERDTAIADRDGQIATLSDETVRRGEWALRLDAALKEECDKLAAITHSNSWRLTLPLREMRRWVSAPKLQGKRYTKGILRLAKRFYQSLPLSYQTKAAHRNVLAKYFPKMLLVSGSSLTTIPSLTASIPNQAQNLLKQSIDSFISKDVIEISGSHNPQVSVIVPTHGQCDFTLRCLASISNYSPETPFEVIVIDDGSPDDSVRILQGVKNIRLISNKTNEGFIRACNAGARAASGRYLHFLNNDTIVTPGWLDELLRTFDEFPGTGLAGSKLLYPDGSLQEAGCIVWRDGSAWNFGRKEDSSLPVYNYAREVDYCSGASLMVPKALFDELGGFDEEYSPAYCEDADLALKIRERGHRVIYQPLSVVFHYEGITSGTDTTSGVKTHQVENTKKLFQRWQHRLKNHQENSQDVDAAKDRRATRRVLVLDHCTPTPDQDSGSIDIFNIMLLLREMDFQATFIPEDNFCYMPKYTKALQRIGVEALFAPHVISVEQHLKKYGSRYDLVFIFRVGVVERNISAVRKYCKKARVLFNTVDLHFLRLSREAALLNDPEKMKASRAMKDVEYAAIRAVDAATVTSAEELKRLQPELPDAKVYLMPFFRDIEGTQKGFSDRRDIVFVGGYQHTPNVDAVQYFVAEIMPLLRQRLPGVKFYVVGSKPPAEIQALACEDVIIIGFVEDLTPLMDKMRLSVAPLRYGAGIKGKIASAMAVGLPVVATALAAEGMGLIDDETVLIADKPNMFAEAIDQIYNDEKLWLRLSRAGIAFAEQAWGVEAGWNTLDSILQKLGLESVPRRYPLRLYTENRMQDQEEETAENHIAGASVNHRKSSAKG